MNIYFAVSNNIDAGEEYALDSDSVTLFNWDKENQKATNLPKSLFLAAPELLEACKKAAETIKLYHDRDDLWAVYSQLIRAISNAQEKQYDQ